MIRVFLADDHVMVRDGIGTILRAQPDMQVVGEASSGEEVLQRVRTEKWDVLLLDINLPGITGLEALSELHATYPKLPVLVLTMHEEGPFALRILHSGAAGFLTKGRPSDELLNAIRTVASGRRYLTSTLGDLLLTTQQDPSRPPHESLSNREYDVLMMLARGKGPGDISRELTLSISTVSTHLARIKAKLGVQSNLDLVSYAIRAGLVR